MPFGSLAGSNGVGGDFLDRQRAVGLVRGEHAVGEFEIVGVDLEQMRGDRARLGDDLLGRHVERRAGHGRRARAAGAFAVEHLVGVALHVVHVVGIEPEPVADQLLEHGLVALALACWSRRTASRVPERSKRTSAPSVLGGGGALDGVGDAEAAQLAALARFALRALKPLKSASSSARSMFFSNSPQS